MTTHLGGCHCGKVRFSFASDLEQIIECNCSHCAIKGLLLTFGPVEHFELLSGEDVLTEYQFGKKTISHRFCSNCGVQPIGMGEGPNGPMVAVNIRCIDGIDLTSLTLTPYDGKSV